MASEIKIKDEPIDRGYEKVTADVSRVKEEPKSVSDTPAIETSATTTTAVATKAPATTVGAPVVSDDDDFAWVNDELDFLNEIDDLVDDSNPAADPNVQQNSIQPVKIKTEPPEEPPTKVQIKLENGGKVDIGVQPNSLGSNIEKSIASDSANFNSNEISVEVSNSGPIASSEFNTSNSNTTQYNLPTDSQPVLSASNVTNSAETLTNGLMNSSSETQNSSTATDNFFFPVRVKQEKMSPPREIPTTQSSSTPIPSQSTVPSQPATSFSPFHPLNPLTSFQPPLPYQPPPPSQPPLLNLPPPPPPPSETSKLPLPGMPVPVVIKQERLSPPPLPSSEPTPPGVDEPSTSRKRQPESPPQSTPISPKRQKAQTSPKESPKKPPPGLDDDMAFLEKQKQKLAKELQKNRSKSRWSTDDVPPSAPKYLGANQVPVPIKIKTEPVDNLTPVDMEVDNEVPEDTTYMKNPLALKLMPQPLKIKQEPIDNYEAHRERHTPEVNISKNIPLRSIKTEKIDDRPMSHRERVIKFAKETIRNMELYERTPKLQRRFLYTPVVLIRENAEKLTENRSPLNSSIGIQYQFSSTKRPLNTEKFGICKLSENTSKIVRMLGFNAYEFSNKMKSHKLDKLDDDDDGAETKDQSAYFVNASTQTEELKCNRCIVRHLKKFVDRGIQISMPSSSKAPPMASSRSYDNVPTEMLQTLSQLASSQQTALMEFTELILGPAPSNTNDVGRMREKLMDIFTLAQSRRDNSSMSNSSSTSNITPTSVLFNQPDRSHQKMQPLFPAGALGQERDSSPHAYQQNHQTNFNSMQPMSHQGQQMSHQGQQMSHQGQQMSHQGQQMSHQGQQMSHQGQQMPHQGQLMSHQGQQMPHQGQQMSHQGQQMSHQGQPIQSLGHQQQPPPAPPRFPQQNQIYQPQIQPPKPVPAPVQAPYDPTFPTNDNHYPPPPRPVDPRTMMGRMGPMGARPRLPQAPGMYRPPVIRDPRANNIDHQRHWDGYQ